MSDIAALDDKWERKLNEVAARINRTAIFSGGWWFWSWIECVDFAEKHISVGYFQWFLDIVSYLQFVTGEVVSTTELQ